MSEIIFAQIDAREDGIVELGERKQTETGEEFIDVIRHGRTAEEELLRLDLELDYLEGVAALQEELYEFYTPLFKELDVSTPDPEEDIEDTIEKWEKENNTKHLDHLYYT